MAFLPRGRKRPPSVAHGGSESPTPGCWANDEYWRRIFSMDFREAFSHNPAHGSFAPLAFQPSVMTNCVNQRFLSY
ncbi:hypothetical protein AXF42_Ash021578 [Apostasia shenzhenica]|uniref:Uncharacterized protein n=1 Tax=Apostasia shenzhenica TaxID=1088818 RepID=A0A2H9ZST1_9ASPA|nr:hypothetical protein AXF42_Ash021578 [Apostasia shenzhenica]